MPVAVGYGAFAGYIDAAWQSWKWAKRAGDLSAIEANEDQLVWLAKEAVHAASGENADPIARRVLSEVLEPAADSIEGVAAVLRGAGWR